MAPESTPYRLTEIERRLDVLDRRTENVNVMESDIRRLWSEIAELREDVNALKRAVFTAALSFAGGAGLIAFTIYQTFGS